MLSPILYFPKCIIMAPRTQHLIVLILATIIIAITINDNFTLVPSHVATLTVYLILCITKETFAR